MTLAQQPIFDAIVEELSTLITDKGLPVPRIEAETEFLGDSLPIDSLDLATLLVMLERRTGHDPFRDGFRQFSTVGQLAALYVP